MTSAGQLAGLLSHIIERPELIARLQAWLDHRTAFHYRDLPELQRSNPAVVGISDPTAIRAFAYRRQGHRAR
jgi:hypothetical protein